MRKPERDFVTTPPEGLLVDPGAYRREGTTGTCSESTGVQVCIITSDQFGELTLSVAVPGTSCPRRSRSVWPATVQ